MTPPQWTDKISDNVICSYFGVFSMVYAILAAITLLGGILLFTMIKMPFTVLLKHSFTNIVVFGLAITQALFLYLICERALKPSMASRKQVQQAPEYMEMM